MIVEEKYVRRAVKIANRYGELDYLCWQCPMMRYRPATNINPEEYDCPSALEPGGPGCAMKEHVEELEEILEAAAELQAEDETEDEEE